MKTRIFAAFITMTLLMLTLCSCGSKTIDLTDEKLAYLTYNGCNGKATPVITVLNDEIKDEIDRDKAKKYIDKLVDDLSRKDDLRDELDKKYKEIDVFDVFFDVEFDEAYTNLSNGDEVLVNVILSDAADDAGLEKKDVEKGLGIKFKDQYSYTVSGLEDAVEVDVFQSTDKMVEVTGFNKHGTAELKIQDGYEYTDKKYTVRKYDYSDRVLCVYDTNDDIIARLYLSIDKTENLSNNDEITISIDMEDSEFYYEDYIFEKTSGTYTVKGLKNATELDFMSIVSDNLKYSGANGNCKVKIEFPKDYSTKIGDYYLTRPEYNGDYLNVVFDNESLGTIEYSIKAGDGCTNGSLTKGDKFIVEIDVYCISGKMNERNEIAKETEKEFTLEDQGEYITKKEDITADELKAIKADALKKIHEYNEEDVIKSVKFATIKPESTANAGKKFEIFVIFDKHGFITFEDSVIIIDNIIRRADGTLEYTVNNYSTYIPEDYNTVNAE